MKQENILASCEGKHAYDRKTAHAVASRQRKNKKVKVEAYICDWCLKWHVGNPEFSRRLDHGERPTKERAKKGVWQTVKLERNGPKIDRDAIAHPIDKLEYEKIISNDQGSAGRDFEALYDAARQTPGTRDSTTLWEPKGFEADDGNVAAVTRYRALSRHLGMIRDAQLIRVCVEHKHPKPHEVGMLREALNEAHRFFSGRRK